MQSQEHSRWAEIVASPGVGVSVIAEGEGAGAGRGGEIRLDYASRFFEGEGRKRAMRPTEPSFESEFVG